MNTNAVSDPMSHIITIPKSILVWCLLLIWALSPLGGQGSLRLMYHANSTAIDTQGLRYWDSGPVSNVFSYSSFWIFNDGSYPLSMRDIYMTALMQNADTRTGPLDQWGNVRIPRLPDANTSNADPDGWYSVQNGTVPPEEYTSLFGVPVIGLSEIHAANINFTIEATYVELSCSDPEYIAGFNSDGVGFNATCLECNTEDSTSDRKLSRANSLLGPPLPELTAAQKANETFTKPQRIKFASVTTQGMSSVVCPVTQRHVEAFIECTHGNCATTKIRASRTDHRKPNYTSFDYWATVVLDMITEASTRNSNNPMDATVGVSTEELFLNDSNTPPLPSPAVISGQMGGTVNLSTVDPKTFSRRASALLNIGLQVFMCPTGFAGDFLSDLTLYGPNHTPANGLSETSWNISWTDGQAPNAFSINSAFNTRTPFIAASTNATVVKYTEVYRPNYVWVVFLFISAALLFCLAVFGLCLRCATVTPNVFDPVMGLTYNNKYMPVESQQSSLDALDRANALGGERVRLGYVEDERKEVLLTLGQEGVVSAVKKGGPQVSQAGPITFPVNG